MSISVKHYESKQCKMAGSVMGAIVYSKYIILSDEKKGEMKSSSSRERAGKRVSFKDFNMIVVDS